MLYGLETVSLRKRQESELEQMVRLKRWNQVCLLLDWKENLHPHRPFPDKIGHSSQDLPHHSDCRSCGIIRLQDKQCVYSVCVLLTCTLNFIPDRSRPGLTTTAIGAVDLQGTGGNWATVDRRSRGGRRVHRQKEKRKAELHEIIVRQRAIIRAYQDQLEDMQAQLSRVSIAAPRDPPPTQGESPQLALPEKFISVHLMELRQGSEAAADYAIRFRTLAAQSGWNDMALWAVFRAGLHPALQSELACHEEATTLSQFVAMAIRLDNLRCQH
ncbi:hypothetical protein QTP70_002138 [Hemibagrus guttatus]|uniref:Retrotransposon gag domain-containing protein n=1 Tax=Hemibagrus guttatus TaxID=175788 RepID=A0AAE0QYQ5_9TELE|nr:hypothetical protein QTP70_002138 [Hemibagrus guttatus]